MRKQKRMRRTLALLMSLVMILTSSGMTVLAEEIAQATETEADQAALEALAAEQAAAEKAAAEKAAAEKAAAEKAAAEKAAAEQAAAEKAAAEKAAAEQAAEKAAAEQAAAEKAAAEKAAEEQAAAEKAAAEQAAAEKAAAEQETSAVTEAETTAPTEAETTVTTEAETTVPTEQETSVETESETMTEIATETESESETETESETEEAEPVLSASVTQEVLQEKKEDDSTAVVIRYTIAVANQTPNAAVENIDVQVLLASPLSYISRAGETGGHNTFATTEAAQAAGVLDAAKLGGTFASYSGCQSVVWNGQRFAENEQKTFVFYAEVKDGIEDTAALQSAWFVAGKSVAAAWVNPELLHVEEPEEELPTEFVFENGKMTVTAILSDPNALPKGAKLVVVEKGMSAQNRALVESTLAEDEEILGYAVYDMHFEVDGREVEPENATVSVSVQYKGATQLKKQKLDENAEIVDTEYKVMHVTDGGSIENVTDAVNGNANGQVKAVDFTTASFSDIIVLFAANVVYPSYVQNSEDTMIPAEATYSLDDILGRYNAFTFGNLGASHINGSVICGGDMTGSFVFGNVSDSSLATNSYIAGNMGKAQCGTNLAGIDKWLYLNPETNNIEIATLLWDSSDVAVFSINGEGTNYGQIRIQETSSYVDFQKAHTDLLNQSKQLLENDPASRVITADDVAEDGTLTLNAGDRVVISNEAYDKLKAVKVDGMADSAGTVISFSQTTVKIPTLYYKINGQFSTGSPGEYDEDGKGLSIVWNAPNATEIKDDGSGLLVGHVVAPDAVYRSEVQGGNYSGTMIVNSIEGTPEGHMWPYKADKLVPKAIHITKAIVGDVPTEDATFTFELYEGEQKIGTTTVKGAGTAYFGTQLYKQEGTHIYTIKEVNGGVAGYTYDTTHCTVTVAVTEDENGELRADVTYQKDGAEVTDAVFTNRYTKEEPETVDISGTKTWVYGNQPSGQRKTTATVQLQKKVNGAWVDVAGKSAEVTADKTTYEFTGLAKYDESSNAIEYRVTDSVTGYEVSGGTSADHYNLKNTYIPETVDISGTKTWEYGNQPSSQRKTTATVQLQKKVNGAWVNVDGKTDTITSEKLTYAFTGLAKYDESSNVIEYRVTDSVTGYEVSGGTSADHYNLTNTYIPETVDISGTKTWVYGNQPVDQRVTGTIVQLQKKVGDNWVDITEKTASVTSADPAYAFTGLAKYDESSNAIEYRVTDSVTGYEVSGGTSADGYNLKNTYIPETVDISGTKTWVYGNQPAGQRVTGTIVQLQKKVGDNWVDITEKTASVTSADPAYAFTGLAKYDESSNAIEYRVTDSVKGYEVFGGTSADGYNLINTYIEETVDISGTKTWVYGNQPEKYYPEEITVSVWAKDAAVASDTKKVSADDDWKFTFSGLPKYKDGVEIEYEIREEKVDNYDTSIEGTTITNTYVDEKVDVSGSKVWDDADDQDGIRPATIKVILLADDTKKDEVTVSAAADGTWSWEFKDLDKYANGQAITYTVEEELVAGYETKIAGDMDAGFVITNTHKPETVEKTVTKVWVDNDNSANKRPEAIEVQLLADGKAVGGTVKLDAAGEWKYTWKDLPKYDKGKEIVYTVQEMTQLAAYQTTYSEDTMTITNTITSTKVSKVDITDNSELMGASLQVTDPSGNVVDSWVSGSTAHEILGLEPGVTYTLAETAAPFGYNAISQNITFTIDANGNVTVTGNTAESGVSGNTLLVKDAPQPGLGSVTVTKRVTFNGAPIALDADFYVALFVDAAGTNRYKPAGIQKLAVTAASNGTATATFTNLPYGTYYVLETNADGTLFSGQFMGIAVEATVENGTAMLSETTPTASATITNNFTDTPPEGYTFVEEPPTEETEVTSEEETETETEVETETEKTKTSTPAKTGDTTNYVLYVMLLAAAMVLLLGAVAFRRRRRQ